MKLHAWLICGLTACLPLWGQAQSDPGKVSIGKVRTSVFYATNGDPKAGGKQAPAVPEKIAHQLSQENSLHFTHYRILGEDTQDLLRSYESWAEPLKPSDEIMVRFEAQGIPTAKAVILDIELWIARKKTIKTDAKLEGDKPLFVLGPEWRGGRLIIAVALEKISSP